MDYRLRVDDGGKNLKAESASPAGSRGQALRGQVFTKECARGKLISEL